MDIPVDMKVINFQDPGDPHDRTIGMHGTYGSTFYSTVNNSNNDNRSNDNTNMYCNLQQQQLNQTKTAKTYNNILLVGI